MFFLSSYFSNTRFQLDAPVYGLQQMFLTSLLLQTSCNIDEHCLPKAIKESLQLELQFQVTHRYGWRLSRKSDKVRARSSK